MKFDKARLVFGLYLLVLIAAFDMAAEHFHLPTWPAFLSMIFFFVEHMDAKKVPSILAGGVFGIALILLAKPIIGVLAPILGMGFGRLVFVLLLVYSSVSFGEMVPLLINNYAFLYLTVTGLAVTQPNPNPFLWMAMTAVGGALLIGGVMGIGKLMMAQAAAKQPAATPSQT